eukprot:4329477-Pyramimonas_sp.AAC.2
MKPANWSAHQLVYTPQLNVSCWTLKGRARTTYPSYASSMVATTSASTWVSIVPPAPSASLQATCLGTPARASPARRAMPILRSIPGRLVCAYVEDCAITTL